MFEKDEDYRKARKESKDEITKVIKVWSAREETLHDEGFQKGAEFGCNKANEWYYVKDGDLPKPFEWVWCWIEGADLPFIARMYVSLEAKGYCWACFNHGRDLELTEVYAWKEIVLPELKESK